MSRESLATVRVGGCFPRVSGDEPWYQYHLIRYQMFSPRERG